MATLLDEECLILLMTFAATKASFLSIVQQWGKKKKERFSVCCSNPQVKKKESEDTEHCFSLTSPWLSLRNQELLRISASVVWAKKKCKTSMRNEISDSG